MDDFDQVQSGDLEGSRQSDQRLDAEWTALNAIREMLSIALKGNTPTYAQAVDVAKVIAPQIYDVDSSRLGRGRESDLVREYRQKAEAESQLRGHPVSPLEVLDEDIERQRRLVAAGDRDLIRKRLNKLASIRPRFLRKEYTESQLIIRDVYKVQRDIPTPPIEGENYRDFRVSNDRGMRVRMLHPDPPEHSIGADLIYENYWEKKQMARVVLIQYKIWNGKVLYLSQARNLEAQMRRMQHVFCETGLCKPFEGSARIGAYRLPYCSPFLRPTDKLQDANSQLTSSSLHVPVCVALCAAEETAQGNKKIESKRIRSESVSHKVFEEMFNANLLGSRWLTYEELENLYRDHKILGAEERIVLHTQEFGLD